MATPDMIWPEGAEAALECVVLDERSLERVELAAPFQTLDGGDLLAVLHCGERNAGQHAPAIDVHGTGTALAAVAGLLRASKRRSTAWLAQLQLSRA